MPCLVIQLEGLIHSHVSNLRQSISDCPDFALHFFVSEFSELCRITKAWFTIHLASKEAVSDTTRWNRKKFYPTRRVASETAFFDARCIVNQA